MNRRDLLLYLRDLGWRDVEVGTGPRADAAAGPTAAAGQDPLAASTLREVAARLVDCTRCRLAGGRKQVVFGVGSPSARVMFVGEGPGADEDRLGEPFVGRAGQLLNEMLRAMGLAREQVYIANVVKCRPPGNRDPEPDEASTCLPFLRRQVELVDPAVIVALGRIAARYLLGTTAPISTYRGRWMRWEGRDLLPTYHPAYLLRNPAAKAQSWADLKLVMGRLGA
ncbi:MAG: uracil-DNA glycosylase [Acidobacteriota bacterium]